jgi:hypothetical protein
VLVLAVTGVTAVPVAAQTQVQTGPQSQQSSANTTTTTPTTTAAANGTNGSAPAPGHAIPASCEDVKQNPTGQGPNYRVVTESCKIQLDDGAILSNVWFKADGARIDIRATGAGWTIRNVAISGHGNPDDPPLNLQINARNGVGLVSNIWISDGDSNALFIHPNHAGTIRFNCVTFLNIGEDGAYASRPGNPVDSPVGGLDGEDGVVGFNQAYVKNMGTGPKAGYGLRLGSDGSYVTNSTIVGTTGPALANTFAGGKHSRQRPNAFDGVLVRNVNIVQPDGGTGIRLNNHQSGLKGKRQWTAITTLQNVQIDAAEPIQRNEADGKDPIIRGDYGTNPTTAPPPGAPRSPELAASGIGGGTGSIGGPVAGPSGGGGGFVAVVTQLGAILALGIVGVVLVVLVVAVALIAWLERGGGGDGSGGFP